LMRRWPGSRQFLGPPGLRRGDTFSVPLQCPWLKRNVSPWFLDYGTGILGKMEGKMLPSPMESCQPCNCGLQEF
ncbi:MAG: hypothetical protein ACFFBV_14375, partial [Promethearchaeota archaeon]